jgi:hypothetical protein
VLYEVSLAVDFLAMGVTLGLAFYLVGRGFPSRLSLKAVVLLLSLSGFFTSAYLNLVLPQPGTATLRALLLVLGLSMWFSIVHQLAREFGGLSDTRIAFGVYAFAMAAGAALLAAGTPFVGEEQNLRVGRMEFGVPLAIYAAFQITVTVGVLAVLIGRSNFGRMPQGRYFLVAALVTTAAIVYGMVSLSFPVDSPRVIQDSLIFAGVFLMGLSIARHQVLVERRTALRDLPVSAGATLGMAGVYALAAHLVAGQARLTGLVFLAAIASHSLHELAREYLERRRRRAETEFRRRLRALEPQTEPSGALAAGLHTALELLCRELDAASALVARRRGEALEVVASLDSLPVGSEFSAAPFGSLDLHPLDHLPELPGLRWLAPIGDSHGPAGALAIGPSRARLGYPGDALDLLVEVADRLGPLLSPYRKELPGEGAPAGLEEDVATRTRRMMDAVTERPEDAFVKTVESALRALGDYSALGRHPLAAWAGIAGDTHVAKGKALREFLAEGIAGLRPPGERPAEPLPREWYAYAILHDAYVEDVKNNEIMARLYISEGTFNRARRNALRGLARALQEMRADEAAPPPD